MPFHTRPVAPLAFSPEPPEPLADSEAPLPHPLDALDPRSRVVFVQAGSYTEALERFDRGQPQTYYGQRYTVDFVTRIARRVERVAVLSFFETRPERQLRNGVHVAGVSVYPQGKQRHLRLIRLVAAQRPTHLVVCAPLIPLLAWASQQAFETLPLLADSFGKAGLRQQVKNRVLARLLNHRRFSLVSNHSLAASQDLVRIGVAADKVIPFDWPAELDANAFAPKVAPQGWPMRLLYVGAVCEDKGVGDAIRGMAVLRERGFRAHLTVVGGSDSTLSAETTRLQLDSHVDFAGRLSHPEVIRAMNEHDALLVPSRHSYPEGLPMTLYEGLCSRTPLIVSDHPMFRRRIRDGESAVVFRAGSETSLADAVQRLANDPLLYEHLSRAASTVTANYFCPLKWHDLLTAFMLGDPEQLEALRQHALDRLEHDLALH